MYFSDYIFYIKKAGEKTKQNSKPSSVKWELGLESHTRRQGEGEGEVGMANLSSLL